MNVVVIPDFPLTSRRCRQVDDLAAHLAVRNLRKGTVEGLPLNRREKQEYVVYLRCLTRRRDAGTFEEQGNRDTQHLGDNCSRLALTRLVPFSYFVIC